jgi:hypothetical protein
MMRNPYLTPISGIKIKCIVVKRIIIPGPQIMGAQNPNNQPLINTGNMLA